MYLAGLHNMIVGCSFISTPCPRNKGKWWLARWVGGSKPSPARGHASCWERTCGIAFPWQALRCPLKRVHHLQVLCSLGYLKGLLKDCFSLLCWQIPSVMQLMWILQTWHVAKVSGKRGALLTFTALISILAPKKTRRIRGRILGGCLWKHR